MTQTLLELLQERYPSAKMTTLRRMVAEGRVSIDGHRAQRVSSPVSDDASVQIAGRPVTQAGKSSLEPMTLVYEDDDLLLVDKPAGLLTSTVPREKRSTALAIVQAYLPRGLKAGLIHRLDRDASGLLVFSKSSRGFDSLKSQFFRHTAGRVYEALVHGLPKPARGTIQSLLVEAKTGKVFSTRNPRTGQNAVTHYEVIELRGDKTLIRVELETGRKHQIRSHLASRGYPIVGDVLYGPQPPKSESLQLRAVELSLDHPATGKRLTFRVEGLAR